METLYYNCSYDEYMIRISNYCRNKTFPKSHAGMNGVEYLLINGKFEYLYR